MSDFDRYPILDELGDGALNLVPETKPSGVIVKTG